MTCSLGVGSPVRIRIFLLFAVFATLFLSVPAQAVPPTRICLTGICHPSIAEEKYIHGPIGGGMCPLCHDEGLAQPEGLPEDHPKIGMAPGVDKCLLCHEEILALMNLGSIHTPVADGDCIDCHNPHQGDNPHFLRYPPRMEEGKRFVAASCHACHEEGDSDWYDDFHASETTLDCIVCHNAHASGENLQLTRYVRDVYIKAALMEAEGQRNDGDLEGAGESYRKALLVFPKDIAIILLLAGTYREGNDWAKAAEQYAGALSLDPAHLEGLIGAAAAARQLEGSAVELSYLKRALEVDSNRADVHLRVGEIYQERKQLQEAYSEFSKAAKLDPAAPAAHRKLIEIYDAMGMSGDAEEERRILEGLK